MGKSDNTTGIVLRTLLVGAAIGGVLGILFAPDKGTSTRKKLLSKGEELKDSLQEKYNALLESQLNSKEKTKS